MTQRTLEQIETITSLFDTNADEVTRTVQVMQSSGLIDNVQEGLDIITRASKTARITVENCLIRCVNIPAVCKAGA